MNDMAKGSLMTTSPYSIGLTKPWIEILQKNIPLQNDPQQLRFLALREIWVHAFECILAGQQSLGSPRWEDSWEDSCLGRQLGGQQLGGQLLGPPTSWANQP